MLNVMSSTGKLHSPQHRKKELLLFLESEVECIMLNNEGKMDILSAEHPFLVIDWGFGILEVINIDSLIDGSHKAVGALNLFAHKCQNIVFTLPPQCCFTADVGAQLRVLSEKINLKLVYLADYQVPFQHDFLESFNSSEDAVLRLKGAIVIRKIIKDLVDVTPFRTSAFNLLELLNKPDISFDYIEKCINEEPLLIARILQVANSAFYMRRNAVEDVQQALSYLGLDGIRQVLVQLMFHNLATTYFSQQKEKLLHCECCAYLAVKLAERKSKDIHFLGKVRVAGLLHDLGSLALQFSYPDEYAKVADLIKSHSSTIQAERSVFGTDHCEVGVRICGEWKLPDYVKSCVAEHHAFTSANNERVNTPVICANAFLNLEIEQLPSIDYAPLTKFFALTPNISNNEAKMEVTAFLYAAWKSFKAEHENSL
ncbi:MAG TPA: hypothetical protein DCG57_03250 [Candidatus Riflebacteria bacterium]|nr:hypothetical protein [Candidatus Riflebacteria bacterium]